MKSFETFLFITIAAAFVSSAAGVCYSDEECPETQQCYWGANCHDPCKYFDSSTKGNCYVRNHSLVIECDEGYEHLPYTYKCVRLPTGCKSNNECDSTEQCEVETGTCFDPCQKFGEGVNGDCSVSNHEMAIQCLEGYQHDSSELPCYYVLPPCQSDEDCAETQQCDYGADCYDPCEHFDNSTKGNCYVINHSVIIECHEGYEHLSSTTRCEKSPTSCKSNNECDSTDQCDVETGTCFDPCQRLAEEANGYCSISNHEVTIQCLEGYQHDSSELPCRPISSACYFDEECADTQQCNWGKGCYDPCEYFDNSTKGNCYVSNHSVVIKCDEGYENLPYTYLCMRSPTGCKSNNECDSTEQCEVETGTCFNPCQRLGEGANGDCSVSNHEVTIQCLEGYQHDSSESPCYYVPQSDDIE